MLEESMSTVPSSSLWASIFSWFTPTVFFVFLNITIGTIFFTSTFSSDNSGAAASGGVGDGPSLHEGDETNDPRLLPSPSVLQRLKSITLYSYRSQQPFTSTTISAEIPDSGADFHISFEQQTSETETKPEPVPTHLDRSPSVLQRLKSINLYGYFSPEQKSHEISSHYTPEEEEIKEPEQVEQTQGEERGFDEIYSELKRDNQVTKTKSDAEPASGEVPTKLPKMMKKSASVKSPFSHFEEDDILEARRPATMREGKGKATEEDDEVDAKADDFIKKFKKQLMMDSILGTRRW
ncbi:bromodomain-containing protein [Gossypium australe]|uniref:Bromodomain-containing protein n=1 Tax=Gossypium australe TaxID=47621 RepID=A0A5B6UJ35_9ROSI|nr:bromodomain-containing protein [Gossypium australe]